MYGSISAISSARTRLMPGTWFAGRPVLDLRQAREFLLGRGHDQLAELAQLDLVLLAELPRHGGAATAERGLQASWLVIDASVYHAAVVAALVHGHMVFLLQHGHADAGVPDGQFAGNRQADDAGADNSHRFE